MKITIAQSALGDLQEIKAYYMAQGVPDVGQKFVNVILKNLQNLRDYPDTGKKVPEFNQDRIREIIYPPFRVVYLRNAASISLVRVWRSERLLLLPDDET